MPTLSQTWPGFLLTPQEGCSLAPRQSILEDKGASILYSSQ